MILRIKSRSGPSGKANATTATAIFNRLSDAAATLQHPDDPRTLPQLRADALAALTLDDDAHDAFTHAMTMNGHHDHEHECVGEHECEVEGNVECACVGDEQDDVAAGAQRGSTDDRTDGRDHGTGPKPSGDSTQDPATSGGSVEDRYWHQSRASARRMRQTLPSTAHRRLSPFQARHTTSDQDR